MKFPFTLELNYRLSFLKGVGVKVVIASDIHGSAYWADRLAEAVALENPDRIVLLGDLLYHGPRNDLPRDYNPKRVIEVLNSFAKTGKLIAVRGNCDSEVDQMVLEVPCRADYAELIDDTERTLFLTHGHIYGAGMHGSSADLPKLPAGSAVLFGHTHIKVNEMVEDIWAFNPGSISLPKDGSHSYGIYESEKPLEVAFRHVEFV